MWFAAQVFARRAGTRGQGRVGAGKYRATVPLFEEALCRQKFPVPAI